MIALTRYPIHFTCLLAGLLASPCLAAPDFETEILPLLETYCYDCHGDGADKGDTAFDTFKTHEDLLKAEHLWSLTRHNLAQRIMPPDHKDQPTDAERRKLIQWIDEEVFTVDCNQPKPGRVTMRRLNRTEYNHTVNDVLHIPFTPADDFPPDDTGYGYDTIGDVLSLSPLMLEKYAAAAEQITEQLIPTQAESKTLWPPSRRGPHVAASHDNWLNTQAQIKNKGTYTIRVTAHGDQAGDEIAKVRVQLDRKDLPQREIPSDDRGEPSVVEYEVELASGSRPIRLTLANDYYKPRNPLGKRDRNIYIHKVELIAPAEELPGWLYCDNAKEDPIPCAKKRLRLFGRHLFRRPVGDAELNRHLHFLQAQLDAGEAYPEAMKLTLQTMLLSPHFLFRSEPKPGQLGEHQLASRLSYFLWSSAPDKELNDLADADADQLRKNLLPQVRRMLADDKADRLDQHFAGQWLQLRNLDIVDPDPKRFPAWNDNLRDAMRAETELLFRHVRESNRPVTELINADYSYLNETLANHYGLKGVKGPTLKHINLNASGSDPSSSVARGGILTHASILTITSYPTRTSPVQRGAWVMETLLGTPPPPPPEDVPDLPTDLKDEKNASLRDRLEKHRDNPLCASCHARIDPIGFGLEHFDAIGAWRDNDHGHDIDATGKLIGGKRFNGHAELRTILATEKADQFVRCMAENMLIYALGRGLTHHDVCALDSICKETKARENRFHAMVEAIIHSVPFQNQE